MPYGILNTDCVEHFDPAGTGSFYNDGEADIVTQHVLNLVHCGIYISSVSLIPTHQDDHSVFSFTSQTCP
jgi:hypothetical protein